MTAHRFLRRNGSGGPSLAYLIDPRFRGGTSSAIAQELRVVAQYLTPRVCGIASEMFHGRDVAPQLETALRDTGLKIEWAPDKIAGDLVVLHNPSFLKFQSALNSRVLARRLIVVTHENFLRPGGADAFDVAGCLTQIDKACLAFEKCLAPVSAANRESVETWLAQNPEFSGWRVLTEDWFNICEFTMKRPTRAPGDRRGRLSRPGFEKFPYLDALEHCFSRKAQSNLLLGANCLFDLAAGHPHWKLVGFGEMEPDRFFEEIDFMVYFTSASWRESFGRVLAEAIAAGKVVITDKENGASFAGAVIAATPDQVDDIIARFVDRPDEYVDHVRSAQKKLRDFSASAFGTMFRRQAMDVMDCPA